MLPMKRQNHILWLSAFLLCFTFFLYYGSYRKTKNQVIVNKRQRTRDFLSGASLNLRVYDVMNSVINFRAPKAQVCLIQKTGLATIGYVGCLLEMLEKGHEREYSEFSKLSAYKGAFTKVCFNHTSRTDYDDYEKLVFIRDPLERFVSGWLYLCKRKGVCFDCDQDVECFMRTLFNCWSTNLEYSDVCTYKSPVNSSVLNSSDHIFYHISPQAAYCRLYENFETKKYRIIPYSRENINRFLRSAAKPLLSSEQFENLNSRLEQPSEHASDQTEAMQLKQTIMNDRALAIMFSILFFIDYEIFSIDLPQFMLDIEMYNVHNRNSDE